MSNYFYQIYKSVQNLEIAELRRRIVALGGCVSWVDDEGEPIDGMDRPCVLVNTDCYAGDVDINKLWIDENGSFHINAEDNEYGYEVQNIEINEIAYGHIEYIFDYLPDIKIEGHGDK